MQLGFNGATTMTSDLQTDIHIAGEAKYDVIEITAAKLDKFLETRPIAEARKLIKAAHLKTHAINSIEKINFRDAAGRSEILTRTRRLAEYAHALDCPWIVAVPGPAPGDMRWEAIRDNTVISLRVLCEVAEPHNVGIAFEFLGFSWCSVQTVTQAWEIVCAVDRANLGMVIDTCHFYAGNSTLDSIRAVDARKMGILHLNDVEPMPKEKITDAHRLFPGDGVIPLKEIIGAVRGIGYDGVASIEIFRPEYWAHDPLAVAREAKKKAEQVLAQES